MKATLDKILENKKISSVHAVGSYCDKIKEKVISDLSESYPTSAQGVMFRGGDLEAVVGIIKDIEFFYTYPSIEAQSVEGDEFNFIIVNFLD